VTPSTCNFLSNLPRWSENPDFQSIFARSALPSKKVQLKVIGSLRTRFPMSLRWTSYVAPKPQKGSKAQNGRFPCKIALRLKIVCYKVSLCENCQRQSCMAFICLSIRVKMIGGDVPFYVNFGGYWPTSLQNAEFQSIFSRSASAVTPSKKFN